jgi:hypothetical protein
MGGDVVLMMPRDASFTLNARVSEKNDIISDFPLKYLPEHPPAPAPKPNPLPENKPKTVEAMPKAPKVQPPGKNGPIIAPIVIARPVVVNPFKRISAVCGGGDATITLSSFGGTLHLKRM